MLVGTMPPLSDSQVRPSANQFSTGVKMRLVTLEDQSLDLPEWQQAHRIGDWAVTNGGKRIRFTREMGDQMIANFKRGVVKKGVHFDFEHGKGPYGKQAGGDIVDVRWGSEYQGLRGHPEPDGTGPVFYNRVQYNNLGREVCLDRRYTSLSPTYSLNYQDPETGQFYGPTQIALTATNDPFARFRSIQGESLHLVLLEDGNGGQSHREDPMPPTTEELLARIETLERTNEDLRDGVITTRTENLINAAISRGVPPADANLIGAIMMTADPDYEATIQLEAPAEGQEPELRNLYQSLQVVLERWPVIELGRQRTSHGDGRPPARSGNASDKQVRAAARQLRKNIGAGKPRSGDGDGDDQE